MVNRLPVDVREALEAIAAHGKGHCWYCDLKLPKARKAIRDGWDVQRLDGQPVASIILVCPACLRGAERAAASEVAAEAQAAASKASARRRLRLRDLPSTV
jgi:hypothetical protein